MVFFFIQTAISATNTTMLSTLFLMSLLRFELWVALPVLGTSIQKETETNHFKS